MKVHFHAPLDSKFVRVREVEAVPCVGDTIVWHGLAGYAGAISPQFKVTEVTHVYEDRPWYSERPDFGDKVCVTMTRAEENEA